MSYLEDLFDLNGKVAVVIGGTGELCGHMAIGLAKAGVTVAIAGRDQTKADDILSTIKATGGNAYFLATDLSEKDSLTELRDAVIKRSGKIDILINGAGVNSPTPFFEIEKEEFQHIFDINLLATMQACQVFGQYFIERGEPASIINLGSISGLNPLSRVFSYSASKAAVHNLSKNLAREWATQNIRVNTLVPGFFPAEQNRKVLDESRVASILGKTPAQRFGTPDELIGATLLLASHNAGSFITGHEMIVDGGFNAMSI
jgi:NAD(P)-dependent dehydrogenase (short-subunit alcohol dehydrogenase family)